VLFSVCHGGDHMKLQDDLALCLHATMLQLVQAAAPALQQRIICLCGMLPCLGQ
jgi:hypothetical protein